MPMMTRTKEFHCHTCNRVTDWHVDHMFVYYHGICHVLVCDSCGMKVPEFAFDRYQETGKVIIPV